MSTQLTLTLIINYLLAGGRLILFRHGNTTQTAEDAQRQLTPLGIEQTAATRAYLHAKCMVFLILSSTLQRVIDTVTDVRWATPVALDALSAFPAQATDEDREESAAINQTFKRLRYVPLARYLEEERAAKGLARWSERAARAIEVALVEYKPGLGTVLIGGHAVLLNALAVAICQALKNVLGEIDMSVAIETTLGEGECLELRVVDGRLQITYLDAQTLGHPTP